MTKNPNIWLSNASTHRGPMPGVQQILDLLRELSAKKILRLTILLAVSLLCWVAVGWLAFIVMQWTGR